MKKLITVLFALAFAVGTLGCAGQTGDIVKNDVFTEVFFADVEQIYFCAVPVSGEQMEPVIRYLQGLALTSVTPTEQKESAKDGNEPIRYGFYSLRFLRTTGEEVGMILDSGFISSESMGSYKVEEEHFIDTMRALFDTDEDFGAG